jgi:serpin B
MMPMAFSESEVNFSGMVEILPNLSISHFFHKAYLEVNETGTKAVAATEIEVEVGQESSLLEVMRVDRPLIFLIRDTEQGAILFVGRMVNPADSGKDVSHKRTNEVYDEKY